MPLPNQPFLPGPGPLVVSPNEQAQATAFVYARSGAGVSEFSGSGSDAWTKNTSGAAVTPFTASGAGVNTDVDSGSAVAPFSGGGSRALVFTKTGTGISPFTGSGADADIFTETGRGISSFTTPPGLVAGQSPSTPLFDQFNRSDENPLSGGGNWATANAPGTTSTIKLLSNQIQVVGTGISEEGAMVWAPTEF